MVRPVRLMWHAHAWHRVFQQRKMREESLLAEMFGRFRNDLVADWFNDDNNYKKAVQDIIDFRRHSTSRIIISGISAHRLPVGDDWFLVLSLHKTMLSTGRQLFRS